MTALSYYHLIPISLTLTIGLIFLFTGFLARLFSWKYSTFFRKKPKTPPTIPAPGYSPMIVETTTTTVVHNTRHLHHHTHLHHNSTGNSRFFSHSPASVVGKTMPPKKVTQQPSESSKAVWMRVAIFAAVHSLPIACQVSYIDKCML